MRRALVIALSLLLALIVSAPIATAQQTGTSVDKKQIGQLSAAWWQQVLKESTPPECGQLDQNVISGKVFYLANFTGTVDAKCTVPSGSKILFPVLNFACSPQLSDPYNTEQALRKECNSLFDYSWKNATGVQVTVDGQTVDPNTFVCTDSPLFNLTVPQGSFSIKQGFGVKGTGPAVSYGCWVLLDPLSTGTHTITIKGTFPLNPNFYGTDPATGEPFTFTQNATYTLTVK